VLTISKPQRVALSLILALVLLLGGCAKTTETEQAPPPSNPEPGMHLVNEGQLTVGSSSGNNTFIDWRDGKPSGFEYDLMQAVADDLELELVYLKIEDGLNETIPAVLAGRLDIAASVEHSEGSGPGSYNVIDPKTLQFYSSSDMRYSIPYYQYGQICLVKGSSQIEDMNGLDGKVVGYSDRYAVNALSVDYPEITLKEYPNYYDGLAALQANLIDAFVVDSTFVTGQFFIDHPNVRSIGFVSTHEQLCLLLSSSNPILLEEVNESLQKLIDDGTYATIFRKYFDYEPPYMKAE